MLIDWRLTIVPVLDDAREVVDAIKKIGNPDAIILLKSMFSRKILREGITLL